MHNQLTPWKDKILFTPGPLTTSPGTKQAMLRDLGSRDTAFIQLVRNVRSRLLEIAEAPKDEYACVIMQGSGTFGIEAVISSAIPQDGKLLVLINGAYGRRILSIAAIHGIARESIDYGEEKPVDPASVRQALERDPAITHVMAVHCETTTGIINDVAAIGGITRAASKRFLVDSMSAFGGVPLNVKKANIDFIISSSNKCIEGVPGFSFIIAHNEALAECKGRARTLVLDLYAQWEGLEKDGQFRFTPPTHALMAFSHALLELEQEGGVQARAARYAKNHDCVLRGMRDLGFTAFLPDALQGHIITSFCYPNHPRFDFADFYARLNAKGYVIYPGKVSNAACFRIGHIGRMDTNDARDLLSAVRDTLVEMGITLSGS
ncbi:MAG: 2-aminoethylphosphonate--pyruvate transaminase [Spirochaetota bacterium]|nr:2-aminoethylphosphonate--pyruvate transaminase [Spirochaetota bacterium]